MSAAAEAGWHVDERDTEAILREMAEQAGVSADRFLSKLVKSYGDRAVSDLARELAPKAVGKA